MRLVERGGDQGGRRLAQHPLEVRDAEQPAGGRLERLPADVDHRRQRTGQLHVADLRQRVGDRGVGPRITGSGVIIAPAVSSAYDISRRTSSASSGSISPSSVAAVSGGRSAIRSAASSADISSRTSAARSLSRCSRISTWSSSGSSSRTSARRSSSSAATTAIRRSGGQVVDHVRRVRGPHLVERGDQVGGALRGLPPHQPGHVPPLDHVGLAGPGSGAAVPWRAPGRRRG